MRKIIATVLIFIVCILSFACSSNGIYNDPQGQRDRAKDAQGELKRDTSRY